MPTSKPEQDLYNVFAAVNSPKEAKVLLEDILTPSELESMVMRWQIVKGLHKGETQRNLAKRLGISISKITRGSRMLQYGSGGFMHFLKKLNIKK
jgi:TrpR family trp operon transcriptional repressor